LYCTYILEKGKTIPELSANYIGLLVSIKIDKIGRRSSEYIYWSTISILELYRFLVNGIFVGALIFQQIDVSV